MLMPPEPQPAAMTPEQLRAIMARAGVSTQVELAARCGVHPITVNRWLKGRTPISAAIAALIRERLKTPPE